MVEVITILALKMPVITNQDIVRICWRGDETQVKELIQNENVLKFMAGVLPKKVIYVKNRLVSIVL